MVKTKVRLDAKLNEILFRLDIWLSARVWTELSFKIKQKLRWNFGLVYNSTSLNTQGSFPIAHIVYVGFFKGRAS